MKYYIFQVKRYFSDELIPMLNEEEIGTSSWLEIEAATGKEAIDKFLEYQNEEVSPIGESEWMAVPIQKSIFVNYEGYKDPPGTIWEVVE